MPPQSRGNARLGSHSKSTPNLPTINRLLSAQQNDAESALSDSETENNSSQGSSADTDFVAPLSKSNSFISSPEVVDVSSSVSGHHQHRARSVAPGPSRPLYSHSSRSSSYLGSTGPTTFAPPFYNRPPTPLPPSPSLTSLLRPAFSTHTSRPGTPDSSDTEATAATGVTNTASAAVAHSARTAKAVPRASPKVPTYEYYGFVLHVGSLVAFSMYLIWSYVPATFLHYMGLYYYPNRWWSLAIPAWLIMCICYIYVALASYNTGWLTLGMQRIENLVDEKARVAVIDENGSILTKDRKVTKKRKEKHPSGPGSHLAHRLRKSEPEQSQALDWRNIWNEGTDAVMDVPIGGVCQVLYGNDLEEYAEYDTLRPR